ncbi:MAG TPA: MBL fold metallo-hydrolase [Chthoniobacteraceae bacterium]|nr:MBL fold metallo-hydrolase [Chthoniobacteraceae bacterium]
MQLPLEDNFSDIIGKVMRGCGLDDSSVAAQAGLTAAQVQQLRDGEWNAEAARKVAPALKLGADAFMGMGEKTYRPAPVEIANFAQFNTPYEDMTVNSYLAWDDRTREAVAFDTGADCTDMLALLRDKHLTLSAILLTHTHGDHIFDLDRLKEKTGAPAFVGDREPTEGAQTFTAGKEFTVGRLHIATRLTWGHSKGGITYVVSGLSRPVAIVGDAVFAGSMGGGGVSFADALATNKAEIFTLSDETVICPGHGPMTTVGEERRNNPFFAA